jgi:hypothetical protein
LTESGGEARDPILRREAAKKLPRSGKKIWPFGRVSDFGSMLDRDENRGECAALGMGVKKFRRNFRQTGKNVTKFAFLRH